VTEETPGEYRVAATAAPATVAALTAWLAERDLPLADLRAGRQRLEDVFLRLTTPDHSVLARESRQYGEERAPERMVRGRFSRRRRRDP
jgi:ABC-2 type transport system ATP-binding protein